MILTMNELAATSMTIPFLLLNFFKIPFLTRRTSLFSPFGVPNLIYKTMPYYSNKDFLQVKHLDNISIIIFVLNVCYT